MLFVGVGLFFKKPEFVLCVVLVVVYNNSISQSQRADYSAEILGG